MGSGSLLVLTVAAGALSLDGVCACVAFLWFVVCRLEAASRVCVLCVCVSVGVADRTF